MLHKEGEIYLLSAGFMTGLKEYGAPPPFVYLGLDRRPDPKRQDTLKNVVPFEPKAESYKRIPVDTKNGFSLTEFSGHPAIFYQMEWQVEEDANPIGVILQAFISTAIEGTDGKLLQTIKFSKPREITDAMLFRSKMHYGFFNVEG